MIYSTLVSADVLERHLDSWVVVDCRFSLDNPGRGRGSYVEGHIPGAVYAHLDEDLSGPIVPGKTGRHPLPAFDELERTFSKWGIAEGVQVVAYDDAGGGIAARLWWLLHYLGHDAAAVLDGGWPEWVRRGFPVRSGVEAPGNHGVEAPGNHGIDAPGRGGTDASGRRGVDDPGRLEFTARPREEWIVDAAGIEAIREDPAFRLLDARDLGRYRGDVEPIDPVAGHIPGAVSAPFKENLSAEGRFRSPAELRAHYEGITAGTPSERIVCYCGSGVTAAHDVLAIAHAGLGYARLYPGSWSEWITDPDRPVAGPDH